MAETPSFVRVPPTIGLADLTRELNTQLPRAFDLCAFGARYEIRSIAATAALTMGVRQLVVRADASAGAITITLPRASVAAERLLIVKRVSSSGTVTVAAMSGDTIDGAASIALTSQWQTLRLVADAVNNAWLSI